jgi:hypothetical protein
MLWLLIAAVVVFLVFAFKAKEIRHKAGLVLATVFFLFLLFSVIQVYRSNKLDLTSFEGVVQAGKIYFSWLGQIFGNIKGTAGYAIKQDWSVNSNLSSDNNLISNNSLSELP